MSFATLKLYWRYRSILNNAYKHNDPGPLAVFLREHMEQDRRVEQAAMARCVHNANGEALLLTVALAQAKSPRARVPLEMLINHSSDRALAEAFPVPWDQLTREQFRVLWRFLHDAGLRDFLNKLSRCLSSEQRAKGLPALDDPQFSIEIDEYLKEGHRAEPLADYVANLVEQSALSNEMSRQIVEATLDVSEKLWRTDRIDPALELLETVALASQRAGSPGWIGEIASNLPRCKGLALVRAANLLRQFPDPRWVHHLKRIWIAMEETTQREHEKRYETSEVLSASPDGHTLTAASAVSIALGVCAATDPSYTSVETKSPSTAELGDLISSRNAQANRHTDLVRRFHETKGHSRSLEEDIGKQIILLQNEIGVLDEKILRLRRRVREQLSGGYLLLMVLQDEQAYPPILRQAAAWGLFKLIETGHLDEQSQRRLLEALSRSVFDRDESQFLAALDAFGLDDSVKKSVREAALEYLSVGNWNQLLGTVVGLSLKEDLREQLLSTIRTFTRNSSPSHQFQERVIQLANGQRLLELESALMDGVVWMFDLVESGAGKETTDESWDYRQLREILNLLRTHIPKALTFFSVYPLRLMTSDQHKRIMGQFVRTKGGVTLWTRYTPPLWRRGANGPVGQVKTRYLQFDDRSAPNAMGISWRLLRHPVLALPVIYHEYMHYGGPHGNPAQGIKNETEVLLREIIFTRGLIARMAPADDEGIPEFERQLVTEIRAAGADQFIARLLLDFESDAGFEFVNEMIERIYGRQLSRDEALLEIARSTEYENQNIRLMNHTNQMKLNWQPEIEWPSLGTTRTQVLTQRYHHVLLDSLTENHALSRTGRDHVLDDPNCQEFLHDWAAYQARGNALRELRRELARSAGAWNAAS